MSKIVGADLARITDRRDAHTYVILLGGERLRPELRDLCDGEEVLLDEGDIQLKGQVYSEMHDNERFWYAVVLHTSD